MDHTKARAVAEALTHGGADDIELIELARCYLDALRQLQERDGVVKEMREFIDAEVDVELSTLMAWAARLEGKP